MATVDLTEATFESTIADNDIVLVDFWADWCGPCKRFAPVFETSAANHPDVVHAKIDTEDQQSIAAAAQITSIPTLMAFREGVLVFSQAGALPPAQLEEVVQGVKNLNMDEVRKQITAAEQGAADGDNTQG